MVFFCCDETRRRAVRDHETLNGIDFLEVSDERDAPNERRQRTLFVHLLKEIAPGSIGKGQVLIEGGEVMHRIHTIRVLGVTVETISPPVISPPGAESNVLVVEVEAPGDFSPYTFRLVRDARHKDPPEGFDPILAMIEFSFKAACPSDLDCRERRLCAEEPHKGPEINYLAKDYTSFRQVMLDRLAVLMPHWKERSPADLGVTLVELLAYVADRLSYEQDAVGTEAYLGTARRRVSVRRHARLIDYPMSEGCNARVWVQVRARSDVKGLVLKREASEGITKFLTSLKEMKPVIPADSSSYSKALDEGPQVFEVMSDLTLHGAHNEMNFYTWGERECCLPKGATRATLREKYPDLKVGDVLILTEKLGPLTGEEEDADPGRRHAVRITRIRTGVDDLYNQPITEIEWAEEDGLPFPLCISSRVGTAYYDNVSVALGNIALADHGLTVTGESLGMVPPPDPALTKVTPRKGDHCERRRAGSTPQRFLPRLKRVPLTHAAAYDPRKQGQSAQGTMGWSVRQCLPAVSLTVGDDGQWEARRDLLNSGPQDKHFVVEVENDGSAFIRFGDDRHGFRPGQGSQFIATYRIGNGARGNVGAGALTHLVSSDSSITTDESMIERVWNPLPAQGGAEPESIGQVRQNAPSAMRQQERAVTLKDYGDVAQRCDRSIQRAAATLRWTGSWHTVFVSVDRSGGYEVDEAFETALRLCLERYRMAGQDLEVDGPRYIPLEVEMTVCVRPDYDTGHVKAALLEVFSNRTLPDGRRGLLHPDNFTFGQAVYLSPLYAAAQGIEGVASVEITKFQRLVAPDNEALKAGRLELGRLEIARLDNDPNFPEQGVFTLGMKGGRQRDR